MSNPPPQHLRWPPWLCVVLVLILGLGLGGTATPAKASPPAEVRREVEVTIQSPRSTIRAGQQLDLTVTATNHGAQAVWTNPSVICTGSWDFIVRNANGQRVRIDDRDLMGCPSGGLLTTRIEPGAATTMKLGWNGMVREKPGHASDAPRGKYEIEVTVRWADRPDAPNSSGPHAFTTSALTSVVVESEVAPRPAPSAKPIPPPPAPAPQPVDDLRQLFAAFEPPEKIVVTTPRGPVRVAIGDYNQAQAALSTGTNLTLPDVVDVDGVKVPYYAAWVAETDHGKRLALSAWAKQQAAKYGTSVLALNAAVAADWTRQGKERDARLDQIRADFERRHGVSLVDVTRTLDTLTRAHQERVLAKLARKYGITKPRLTSWGPAAGSLGISGFIHGKPVLLYQGKIYRDGERPPSYYTKCLPPETLIATPRGELALATLAAGDTVWTLDRSGRRVEKRILIKRVAEVTAPHTMVGVTLADGRDVRVSALHPSARGGVAVGDWRAGDSIDGSEVVDRTVSAYEGATTQDILPAGDTHLYWANGIIMGSTLVEP
jgi:hypothetical protein